MKGFYKSTKFISKVNRWLKIAQYCLSPKPVLNAIKLDLDTFTWLNSNKGDGYCVNL